MNRTVSLPNEQWAALEKLAKLGILAADLLGPDDADWFVSDKETQAAHDALALVNEHAKDQMLGRVNRVRIDPPSFKGSQRGISEGWYMDFDEVAECYRVYALEGSGKHKDDKHALAFVTGNASLGSDFHQSALDWIEAANAMHFAALAVAPAVKLETPAPRRAPAPSGTHIPVVEAHAVAEAPKRRWGGLFK